MLGCSYVLRELTRLSVMTYDITLVLLYCSNSACSCWRVTSPGNVKALFRRGQSLVGLGRTVEAEQDFVEAAQLAPKDKNVREELKQVSRAW